MGSLYRRCPSKELLTQWMRVMGREQLVAQARTALAEEPDPWAAFARFLRNALSAQGAVGPLLPLVGDRLPATGDIVAPSSRLRAALADLVDGVHRAGVLRADLTSADVPLLLEHLTARIPVTDERATTLRLRYLDLILTGLRTSTTERPTALQSPAPDWAELSELADAPEASRAPVMNAAPPRFCFAVLRLFLLTGGINPIPVALRTGKIPSPSHRALPMQCSTTRRARHSTSRLTMCPIRAFI